VVVVATWLTVNGAGGSIGAGLFVGSGGALNSGGPASIVSVQSDFGWGHWADGECKLIGFIIIGCMLLFTVQALGELAVLYPVNGAFFSYGCRFIDEAW